MEEIKVTIQDVVRAYKSSAVLEDEINVYMKRLDMHLALLHKAMTNGCQNDIEFQKAQLEKVHRRLFQLEAFPFKKK